MTWMKMKMMRRRRRRTTTNGVGRGNVQVVRAARKRAGLSEGFPRSDTLLVEFANFMQISGCASKDISNKVISINAAILRLC